LRRVRNQQQKILGLEKRRAISSTIDSLLVDKDKEVKNYNEVLNEIRTFYQNYFQNKI